VDRLIDIRKPLFQGGFFFYKPVELGDVKLLLPQPVFKLFRRHPWIEKIRLLFFSLHCRTPDIKS